MSRFFSKKLSGLESYTPGEQPADMEKLIKLNTNESPYPPSPKTIAALCGDEAEKLNLYPNPDGTALVNKLAQTYNVKPENIIIGNGSDELLAFSFLAFFEQSAVFPDITYGFYPVYARLFGTPYTEIPLRDDFSIDVTDYTGIAKNIILANPNAPTGIALPLSDIEQIIKTNPDNIVLLDEAYADFGAQSAVSLVGKYDNLLVMHTYSKARSLAGGRLAYAIAAPPLTEDLRKIKYSFNPYNVNRLTQAAGLAALEDEVYYAEKHSEIIKTREYTSNSLKELGYEMTPSKANFLFVKNPRVKGAEIYKKLKDKGILVRHWDKPRISDYLRITIGTREQTDALIRALKEIEEL